MTRRTRSPRLAALLVLVVGLAVVALYFVLQALPIGKIGQPTDIGGLRRSVLGLRHNDRGSGVGHHGHDPRSLVGQSTLV